MRKWWIPLLLLLTFSLLAALLPMLAQTTDDDTEVISAALADVPGLVDVVGVTVGEEEGQAILLVKYITIEMQEIGYYAEVIDAFRAIGETLPETGLELDSIVIYTGIDVDDVLERLEVSADVLADFVAEELTRSAFWDEVETIGLEHQLPEEDQPGDEV